MGLSSWIPPKDVVQSTTTSFRMQIFLVLLTLSQPTVGKGSFSTFPTITRCQYTRCAGIEDRNVDQGTHTSTDPEEERNTPPKDAPFSRLVGTLKEAD